MENKKPRFFLFDSFLVDEVNRRLHWLPKCEKITIASQAFDTLIFFLNARVAAPSRELWSPVEIVEGSGIHERTEFKITCNRLVSRLVKTLAPYTTTPFFENRPRSGYAFNVEVRVISARKAKSILSLEESGESGDEEQLPMFGTSYEFVPASRDDILWAAALAKRIYRGNDVIPASVMLEWFDVNRNGFSVIKLGKKRIGNLDILPLKRLTLKRFEAGKLLEKDIVGDSLYTVDESNKIEDLYIESFVCPKNPMAVPVVLSQFESIVKRLCAPNQVKRVFAISASPGGTNMLGKLGFKLTGRAQGHDLYSARCRDVLAKTESVVNDFLRAFGKRAERRRAGRAKPDKPGGL